ncbi:porin [Loktanella salsilacus]|uniref:Porin n=1 Tax=Loktanella salsilacus TaxID=195913 RepID=A0A1I4DB03_9RHOB|nr:porin [Loktanella salsilacus]SFK90984.1 porin [Loktanella salsilacus]
MKSILLTSTALVAFAGAAAAESHASADMMGPQGVVWGADGEFGYNKEVEDGFYFDGGLAVSTSAGMNMGLTAGLTLDVDLTFNDAEGDVADPSGDGAFSNIGISGSDFVVFVEGQGAAVYAGDTATASEKTWSGTTNMENDGFLEVDDVNDGADDGDFVDGVIRGDLAYGPVTASLSFLMADGADTNGDLDGLDGLQFGAVSTFGAFTVGMTYQQGVSGALVDADDTATAGSDGIIGNSDDGVENPGTVDEVIGVFASTTFSGANVKVAYATNLDTEEDSVGFQLDYPFGPVTATVFYSIESAVDDNYGVAVAYANGPVAATAYYHDGNDQEIGLEGSYDFGMGLTMYAGYIQNDGDSDATEAYAAAEYDLGGGASLIAAYGDAGDTYTGDNDEIGNAYEVNEGTTIAVSFTF